ncbi:hypothetical protein C5H24_12575 [Xylella fastidiosa]|nr:hypothetical protein C5H24_12575 [Xylella fastidiosa]
MEPASQYNQLVKAKKEEIRFPFSKAKDKRKRGVKSVYVGLLGKGIAEEKSKSASSRRVANHFLS